MFTIPSNGSMTPSRFPVQSTAPGVSAPAHRDLKRGDTPNEVSGSTSFGAHSINLESDILYHLKEKGGVVIFRPNGWLVNYLRANIPREFRDPFPQNQRLQQV